MKPWQHILLGILLGLLFAGMILLLILPQRGTPIPLVTVTPKSGGNSTPEVKTIKVELAGAVNRPGVYDLPEGIHLVDAIDIAGGKTAEADLSKLNLAMILKDGQKVTIPTTNTQNSTTVNGILGLNNLLDINTATADQLMALPQIGELKAQAILTYRNDHGRFQSLEDLMEVPGIGESIFEAVKHLITIIP
ncbi:MAG TPA: ComEA family DNA-binding protein [Anaerolineaceae bacterium]|nr:ComEA family DNA-binding protein [Anaerolineaceae bacterium]